MTFHCCLRPRRGRREKFDDYHVLCVLCLCDEMRVTRVLRTFLYAHHPIWRRQQSISISSLGSVDL